MNEYQYVTFGKHSQFLHSRSDSTEYAEEFRMNILCRECNRVRYVMRGVNCGSFSPRILIRCVCKHRLENQFNYIGT